METQDIVQHALLNVDEVILRIFDSLPMCSLMACSRVCKKWNALSCMTKRSHNSIEYFLLRKNEKKNEFAKGRTGLFCYPRETIMFTTTEQPNVVDSEKEKKRTHKGKRVRHRMTATEHMKRELPLKGDSQIVRVVTHGIVGTTIAGDCYEVEGGRAASCVVFPHDAKVTYHAHSMYLEDKPSLIKRNNFTDQDSAFIQDMKALGTKCKFVLVLYGEEALSCHFESIKQQPLGLARELAGAVVAGAFVDQIEADGQQDPEVGPDYHYLVFSGDDIQVASVVLHGDMKAEKEIEQEILKLKTTGMRSQRQLGFMLACCGRGQYFHNSQNKESRIFRKVFPSTPLVGLFGNGEIGSEFLPDYSGDGNEASIAENIRNTVLTLTEDDMVHSYCTVFVLLSLGLSTRR